MLFIVSLLAQAASRGLAILGGDLNDMRLPHHLKGDHGKRPPPSDRQHSDTGEYSNAVVTAVCTAFTTPRVTGSRSFERTLYVRHAKQFCPYMPVYPQLCSYSYTAMYMLTAHVWASPASTL